MTAEARKALRTSDPESAKEELVPIGARLARIRSEAGLSQTAFAEALGVTHKSYVRWERGIREIGVDGLQALISKGWSANWLLTGEGPERLEGQPASDSAASQAVSEENLSIALDFAIKAIRGRNVDLDWVPTHLFARLQRLLYDGITRGLPLAEVRSIAEEGAEAIERGMRGNVSR